MMSTLEQKLRNFIDWCENGTDPRSKDWPLIQTPWVTYGAVVAYLIIVWQGPKFMAKRKPFDLRQFMILYNAFLVVLSAYMFQLFLRSAWPRPGFSWACAKMDYSDDPSAVMLAKACWWFFFSKLIEFMDTFIFILRKKNNQISFLHVYHHTTMPMLWWIGVKWVPGGQAFFSAMINCFVHTVMYGYYLLAAMGPRVQPFLWWKKYITSLQLAQFVIVMIQTILSLYIDCGYPRIVLYALAVYMVSHIILFGNFFNKTYRQPRTKAAASKEVNGQTNEVSNGYVLRKRQHTRLDS
ncbi:very long chain fatty acid elongase 4-like [Ptychodera flava]|uniref:very long chain fatty acid elongase 4-like n=1 Tax=Ptychodera flava TaxID=63121 RepID=UPI00396A3F72